MRTVEHWHWSTTTPSGVCSSGGSQSSAARLPAHPDDDEGDGDQSGMASRYAGIRNQAYLGDRSFETAEPAPSCSA